MGCLSQVLLIAVACSFALALVLALFFSGLAAPSLFGSSLDSALARSLSLSVIPKKAGILVPPTSDGRPRVFTPSKPGACLKFIHIPKTGGTTIENIWRQAPSKADPRVSGWARTDPKATCTGNRPANTRMEMFPQEEARRCPVPGFAKVCNYYHTPPMQDPLLWKTGFEPCDTFCMVRHPLDKFESEWQYATNLRCQDPHAGALFEKWAREKLDLLDKGELYFDGCHMLPMHKFVFHSVPGSLPARSCTHILRFEHFEQDFDSLMEAYNYSLAVNGMTSNNRSTCNLNMSEATLLRIRRVYAEDFSLFGYD